MKLGPYELGQIYTGDAKVLCKEIPDESIDLIITDPEYSKKYLPLYEWLSKMASKKLKEGGWVFAYGAAEHLPDEIQRMSQYLDYFWVFVLLHYHGYPRMWYKKLFSGYKPILVYTKGTPTINPWMSTVHSDARDKRFHKWGQGEGFIIKMIEMLTAADHVILDPFVGGGTVPAVCKKVGRANWLAFEIYPQIAEIARDRVQNTPVPLLSVKEPQQGVMKLWKI